MYEKYKDSDNYMSKIRYYLKNVNYFQDIDEIIIDNSLAKAVEKKYFNDKVKTLGSKPSSNK